MRKFIQCLVATFACFILLSRSAHAYLDPGTGSVLLQFLAVGALSIGVAWRFIVAFFRKRLKKNSSADQTEQSNAEGKQ